MRGPWSAVSIIRTFAGLPEGPWRKRTDLPPAVSEGSGTALTAVAPPRRRCARQRADGAVASAAHDDRADRQRHRATARGRGSLDARRAAARPPRADRHQDRLRPRRVRRLHRAAGRQAGLLVQPARGLGRRPLGSDGRRTRANGTLSRCSRRSSSTTRRSAASARRVS